MPVTLLSTTEKLFVRLDERVVQDRHDDVLAGGITGAPVEGAGDGGCDAVGAEVRAREGGAVHGGPVHGGGEREVAGAAHRDEEIRRAFRDVRRRHLKLDAVLVVVDGHFGERGLPQLQADRAGQVDVEEARRVHLGVVYDGHGDGLGRAVAIGPVERAGGRRVVRPCQRRGVGRGVVDACRSGGRAVPVHDDVHAACAFRDVLKSRGRVDEHRADAVAGGRAGAVEAEGEECQTTRVDGDHGRCAVAERDDRHRVAADVERRLEGLRRQVLGVGADAGAAREAGGNRLGAQGVVAHGQEQPVVAADLRAVVRDDAVDRAGRRFRGPDVAAQHRRSRRRPARRCRSTRHRPCSRSHRGRAR